jgi:hypothetical protein
MVPSRDKERDETLLRMLRMKPKPHVPIGKRKADNKKKPKNKKTSSTRRPPP